MFINSRKIICQLDLITGSFLIFLVLFIFSCEKLELKRVIKVSTGSITDTTRTSCIAQGTIIETGEEGIAQHGHCWSTKTNPSISDSITQLGSISLTGNFNSNLTCLSADTKYYVRAYALDIEGKPSYGNEVSFTTLPAVIPSLTTSSVSNITADSATCGGNITDDGDASVTAHGVCWSTSQNPTVADSHTNDGSGTGSFTSNLFGLSSNTTYYVRAYATNSAGTAYGNELNFKTSSGLPSLTTTIVTSITATTASSGGNITNNGGTSIIARGVCWSTSQNPTVAHNHTDDGTGAGSFTSSITGLTSNTTYYVRAYATNSAGTAYGDELSFKTNPGLPSLTTSAVTSITATTAISEGNITNDGGAAITVRGVCWSTTTNPTIANSKTTEGTGMGSFVSNLTGLTSNTTYYVRAYATNSAGTAYGNEVSFKTSAVVPSLTTTEITSITATTASSGGNITNDGGASVTARGVCWSTSQNPTVADSHTDDGNGTGSFTSILTGLSSNTTYYVRAYATNSAGTAYGNELSFKTSAGIPSLITEYVTSITANTAISGGNITNDGGATIEACGVCWSTSQSPTLSDNHTSDVSENGNFTSNITGLSTGTTYYVRAYATNSAGTAYGNEINFTTAPPVPTNISATPGDKEVTIKWNAVSEATSYNIYWSINPGVSKTNFEGKFIDITTTSYSHTGLTSGTTYYYVVTAKNNYGESNESSEAKATPPLLLQTNTISHDEEKHFYEVSVSSGQSLFVNINVASSQFEFYLYGKYGSLPTTTDYDAKSETGEDGAISITNTQSGTYYIMVYASYYYSAYSGDYTITASTAVTALTFGTSTGGIISHDGEKHFYEVSVSSGQSLCVNINIASSQFEFYLYGKYGSLPTTTDYDAKSETGEDEAISITNTQSGTYYIMVYASYYYSTYSGDYTITAFTSK